MMLDDLITTVNKLLSPIIMILLANSFCWLCIFIFTLIVDPQNFWETKPFLEISYLLVNLFMISLSVAVIKTSVAATTEGKSSSKWIFKFLVTSDDKLLNQKMILLVQQISYCKLTFGCGLFNFDWKLCFKVS